MKPALENARSPAERLVGSFSTFLVMSCRWGWWRPLAVHQESPSAMADSLHTMGSRKEPPALALNMKNSASTPSFVGVGNVGGRSSSLSNSFERISARTSCALASPIIRYVASPSSLSPGMLVEST